MDEKFKNKNNFSHFKIHSQYTICEGAVKIDDLSKHCKDNKVKSVGLCDSYNLCGALEFSEKISKNFLLLPLNLSIKKDDIVYISSKIKEFFTKR